MWSLERWMDGWRERVREHCADCATWWWWYHIKERTVTSSEELNVDVSNCCIAEKENKADVQIYNLLLIFFFLLLEMDVMVEWESVEDDWAEDTQGQNTNLKWNLFSSFSTFPRLVQRHLKASNNLSYSSLLNPGQSGARPTSRATWRFMTVFRGLLSSARLCWLYNIWDALANFRGHISSLPPTCCTWTCLLLACHLRNLRGISIGIYASYLL